MKLRFSVLGFLLVLIIITCINPVYPKEQFLQHLGTLILLIPLIIDLRKKSLWTSSYIGLAIFTAIHIVGARYIYSNVPYNQWVDSIFGFNIDSTFGFERNQYDRFVHLGFGLLFFPYILQLIRNWKGLSQFAAVAITWAFIQSFSLFYELFEWTLTIVMSSEAAENYNGQQGDIWDAQKDMALAFLGSSLAAAFYLFKKK